MGKTELIKPSELLDSTQVVHELEPGQPIVVPELILSDKPEKYPVDMLKFFRLLWRENGYARIKMNHDDAIILPPERNEPPVFLLNSYRGISDGNVVDRKPFLKEYRRQRHILTMTHGEQARIVQKQKLDRILARIPDLAGVQGVETYKVFIPYNRNSEVGVPLQGSDGLVVTKTYHLGPERSTYDLPIKKGSMPVYPNQGSDQVSVFCDGERFNPATATNPEYFANWQRLGGLVIPLLERTSQQH